MILIAGAFATYYFWPVSKGEVDAWNLVSRKSLAVWEISDLRAIDSVLSFPPASTMASLLSYQTEGRQLLHAYQVSGDHVESILFFDLSRLNRDSIEKNTSRKNRLYEGKQILEFQLAGTPLAFTSIEGLGLLATNSLLIEEAIRQYKAESPSFKQVNSQLFTATTLKNDAGNLYLNWVEMGSLLKQSAKGGPEFDLLADLCRSLIFDFKIAKNSVLLSGFAMDTTGGADSFLSLFAGQSPVKLRLQKMVPEDFEWAVQLGVAQGAEWNNKRMATLLRDTLFAKSLGLLKSRYGFDVNEFWKSVGEEILLVQTNKEQAIFIELREVSKVSTQFNGLQKEFSRAGNSKREIYGSHTLTTLKSVELCRALLHPLMPNTRELTITLIDNILVGSPDINYLKQILDQLGNESTLGKSLAWGKFLSNTQQEANVSILVNGQLALPGPLKDVQFPYDKASLQFTALDKYFYASSFLSRSDKKVKRATIESVTSSNSGATPRTSLYVVVNHNSKQNEILYQDTNNNLVLVGADGKVLWQKTLETTLLSPIYQIDFLKNNKLQYLFATSGRLYVVDRLGNNVAGFPINLPVNDATYLSLIDYNRTKEYRFLIANERGDIWIYNKLGRALEGWNPKRNQMQLSLAPEHVRLAGRDYFKAVSRSGEVTLWNRRGEIETGFPLMTRLTPSGDFAAGGDHLFLVSSDGHFLKISINGKIIRDEVLLKNHSNARFGLCANAAGNDFLIYRVERGQLACFDSMGTLQFEMVNTLSENLLLKYFSFGGQQVLLAFDPEQQLFVLVDGKGKMLTQQPLESATMPGIVYSKSTNEIAVHAFSGQTLKRISIQL